MNLRKIRIVEWESITTDGAILAIAITALGTLCDFGVQVLLAKGCDVTRRDYTGRTALMWAEWSRKNGIVRALKHAGVRE